MEPSFQEQLENAFPAESDGNMIRAVRQGLLLADHAIESEGFLRNLVGQDLRGHLRRAGILFTIHDMAAVGDIPFEANMVPMPRGNWHWVELRSQNFNAHICRSDGPTQFPEETPVRQDTRLVNQPDLFLPAIPLGPPMLRLAWLTFGAGDAGNMSHLCWGMPSAKEDEWLARINILRRYEASGLEAPLERPTRLVGLRFREHIEEALDKGEAESDEPDR
jgi:hypothetical protein